MKVVIAKDMSGHKRLSYCLVCLGLPIRNGGRVVLQKNLYGRDSVTTFNMVLQENISCCSDKNVKGQWNTITTVDSECWLQNACSEGMLTTPPMMLLLIRIPLKAPLDKHNDELPFSCQATHVCMRDRSVKLGIYFSSNDQFFILFREPAKLFKTTYCRQKGW